MPYKDDNLYELFQKAAEDYPLNTDNSDWNSIAGKVGNPVHETFIKRNSKALKYALLLFLFLSGSLALYKFQFQSDNLNNKTISNKADKSLEKQGQSNAALSKSKNSENQIAPQTAYNIKDLHQLNISRNKEKVRKINSKKIIDFQLNLPDNQTESPVKSEENLLENVTSNQQIDKSLSVNQQINSAKNTKSKTNNSKSVKSNKQIINLKTPGYKFYGSLFVSPEFSLVKFQHLTKPGFSVGVSLGYRINSRFNIELGLQRENINVYSDGKYFNADNIRLKPETAIENLHASSKTTSVPLALRYNVSSKNNRQLFVTAGVNAVLITHNEKYNYSISRDGSQNSLSRKYSSVTNPKYFTGINVSAGYETKLNNWCNFKVEPYYQAPIRKFGIGELPVSSFGLNIGIVKNLK